MPRFQFTFSESIWAIIWVAVGFVGLSVPTSYIHLWYDQWRNEYYLHSAFVAVVIVSMAVVSLGGLVAGRHRQAVQIAIISIALAIMLSFLIAVIWGPADRGRWLW